MHATSEPCIARAKTENRLTGSRLVRILDGGYEAVLRTFIAGKQRGVARFAASFAARRHWGLFLRNQAIEAFAIPKLALVDPSDSDADRVAARFGLRPSAEFARNGTALTAFLHAVAIAPEWRPGVSNPTRNGIPMNDLRLTGITVPNAFTERH
jgi:hypothetical protein